MAALRRRRIRKTERDNHERWIVSYADFMTLLFAFFVVMYGVSSVNEGKSRTAAAALTQAFGDAMAGGSKILIPINQQEAFLRSLVDRRNARMAEQLRRQADYMARVFKGLNQVMGDLIKGGQVKVTQNARGIELEISASALFATGDAAVQAAASKTLSEVARVLSEGDQAIEVNGYTDDIPISSPQYPSNWELSSARASSVVRLFSEHGVAGKRLTAIGLADNNPIDSNLTPEGRAHNRRITVTLLAPQPDRNAVPAAPVLLPQ